MIDDWADLLLALLDAHARFLIVGAHALSVHRVGPRPGDPSSKETVTDFVRRFSIFSVMKPTAQLAHLRRRVEDLLREVGTLLLAFAPLDAVLWGERPDRTSLVLTFSSIGVALILTAVFSELRRLHG